MINKYKKIKNLFLRQSYLDSWEDYCRSLQKTSFIKWDYVILTASNETQAQAFQMQIQKRLEKEQLPLSTHYAVIPDPEGKRVGSGGATFNVLKYIAECESKSENLFAGKRILVIHSGGDSKRIPQYSAIGKLFSPAPHVLPDGRASTLFDELIVGMSGMPARIREGMLVLSGDVLLLFNPLQIDSQFDGAAAISIKEPVDMGKNHGVFMNDGKGKVKRFLHKQPEETLRQIGAVNDQGMVDLDTGAILINVDILNVLYGLISTNGIPDQAKFNRFANERARVSFYGDLLYPLAQDSTLEQYYKEEPEGEMTEELIACRTELWETLRRFSLKLFYLSPAQFLHFGTTYEVRQLFVNDIADFEFLDWKNNVISTVDGTVHYAAYESYIGRRAVIEEGAYLEDSYILDESHIGKGSVVSNIKLRSVSVPPEVVLHSLPLSNGKFVARIFGVTDNPKETLAKGATYLRTTLKKFVEQNNIDRIQLWDLNTAENIWNAKLFVVCDAQDEAVEWALKVYEIAAGSADVATVTEWLSRERMSLRASFNCCDMNRVLIVQNDLKCRILCKRFVERLMGGTYYKEALDVFGNSGISEEIYNVLMEDAKETEFSTKIRIYYALSRYMKHHNVSFQGEKYDYPESQCFKTIQDIICDASMRSLPAKSTYRIAKESVEIRLPVRVNFGGGWTDTPPYCIENGGAVLNAAIRLNGELPIHISVKRISDYHIEFESQDVGAKGSIYTVDEIRDCHNPYDTFALHKASLMATGIVPAKGDRKLQEILKEIGGGLYLSTEVIGIPKGSGLGTSSILAGACVKGLFELLGQKKSDEDIYRTVLCMEQIMSTGGGWQDQVGGLTNGIKLISTMPGVDQKIKVEPVKVSNKTLSELRERLALIYTGQRRLARNLLRNVIGGYICANAKSVEALEKMKQSAVLMKFYLEHDDIDAFAQLLNDHWKLSKQLDSGSTNTCIDQIFVACEDLIDAQFISGAGGGGFIIVLLKKGISKQTLRQRLWAIFQNSGVDVWDAAFI